MRKSLYSLLLSVPILAGCHTPLKTGIIEREDLHRRVCPNCDHIKPKEIQQSGQVATTYLSPNELIYGD